MEGQNTQKGKEKCRELRQRGGVPRAYAKWAEYLIPGYKEFWDSEWERLLLAEEERLQEFEQGYREFERELHKDVEILERGNAEDAKKRKASTLYHTKSQKASERGEKTDNGNKKT